jgi:hypothetical protein
MTVHPSGESLLVTPQRTISWGPPSLLGTPFCGHRSRDTLRGPLLLIPIWVPLLRTHFRGPPSGDPFLGTPFWGIPSGDPILETPSWYPLLGPFLGISYCLPLLGTPNCRLPTGDPSGVSLLLTTGCDIQQGYRERCHYMSSHIKTPDGDEHHGTPT